MSTPRNVTNEERAMVKDAIVIPVMLNYIDNDISTIQKSGLNTDIVLVNGLKKVQDDIINEHIRIKRQLRERGIKIVQETRSKSSIESEFLCRGYNHKMSLLWSTVRTEVLHKASQYTSINLVRE
ncbi:hypothetical protein [Cohnella cholangitidis]|uniref:Uncharacterized protein n=1 Tax=Cohnella cholangitidis TaxID=2598458 RepID=A0A7G5BTD9_9BACL|nr:hypothetical protein [Cohnella cholangitidis]QMV40223.1 hypothetical protein FPL14_02660 [Cohnella cholangitidis]